MGDLVERPFVSGRQSEPTLRENVDADRSRWLAWVKVPGKEHERGSSASFSGLSEGHVRDQAERWMLEYRS